MTQQLQCPAATSSVYSSFPYNIGGVVESTDGYETPIPVCLNTDGSFSAPLAYPTQPTSGAQCYWKGPLGTVTLVGNALFDGTQFQCPPPTNIQSTSQCYSTGCTSDNDCSGCLSTLGTPWAPNCNTSTGQCGTACTFGSTTTACASGTSCGTTGFCQLNSSSSTNPSTQPGDTNLVVAAAMFAAVLLVLYLFYSLFRGSGIQ